MAKFMPPWCTLCMHTFNIKSFATIKQNSAPTCTYQIAPHMHSHCSGLRDLKMNFELHRQFSFHYHLVVFVLITFTLQLPPCKSCRSFLLQLSPTPWACPVFPALSVSLHLMPVSWALLYLRQSPVHYWPHVI